MWTNAHCRSHTSRARDGSSSVLVVAEGRRVSRCKRVSLGSKWLSLGDTIHEANEGLVFASGITLQRPSKEIDSARLLVCYGRHGDNEKAASANINIHAFRIRNFVLLA